MEKMTRIDLRIDKETKLQAKEIMEKMDITISIGIRLFLQDIAKKGKFPFELPTAEYRKSKEEEFDEYLQKIIDEHKKI